MKDTGKIMSQTWLLSLLDGDVANLSINRAQDNLQK
jgi:hypothetical protein